jgi:hypothetical protein
MKLYELVYEVKDGNFDEIDRWLQEPNIEISGLTLHKGQLSFKVIRKI